MNQPNHPNQTIHQAIYSLEETHPEYSMRLFIAKLFKSSSIKLCLHLTTFLLLAMIIIAPKFTSLSVFLLLSILYIIMQLSKLFFVITGALNSQKPTKLKLPKKLPIYSLLLPLYKEGKVLAELINSISKIDYPPHLLDVKLLIEEDDQQTLEALEQSELPAYIEVIKVPVAHPRTKPKACNYGLQFAKGKYVTIYDAEDRPDPQQLKQAVAMFTASDERIVCLQARLNFYNFNENLLTKLFALEYSILFDYLLVGLAKLGLPIPLGGTSNHFIRDKLIELGGWDAFNVTEDADLGMRIYQLRLSTALLNSLTLEEAPVSYMSWIVQRSRWIKGRLLTSLLHLSNAKNLSFKAMLGIVLTLLLPNLGYVLLPIYLLLGYFIDDESLKYLYQLNISLSLALPIGYAMLISIKQKWISLKEIIFASPFYYLLTSIASVRALIQIFKQPFHWDKTTHGVSKLS